APHARGRLDLYRPEAPARGTRPLIVFFHGGGWQGGEKEEYRFVAQPLCGLGCEVAVPNYRLFPEARWPAFVEDGAAAVTFLRRDATDGAGPVFLMGHSAGAFIALSVALDPRWLEGAGMPGGRGALGGAIGLAGPYDFAPEEPAYRAIFSTAPGGRARVAPAEAARLAGAPPLLLLHGTADRMVSAERSRDLAALARMAGVEARVVEYPGVGHIGIIAALAAPLRVLGLAPAPVLHDVRAFVRRGVGGYSG
ncbi:MAG TPA: alpha/beta hydrolase, partial [Acetobacteraceae bacterium]|nr:alpha/beta hydrolase [Acetobacteraceae bacterium]